MYKGPMDMDNRVRIVLGSGGWAGQGRATEENWDNYNRTTIIKKNSKLQKKSPFFFDDTLIGGMDKIKLVFLHRVLIESNLPTYTKHH